MTENSTGKPSPGNETITGKTVRQEGRHLLSTNAQNELREAAEQALGSLKALGAENGFAAEALRVALQNHPAPASQMVGWIANCCSCGRIVDTREIKNGGDPFGAELSDGRWTCSAECWGAVVDPDFIADGAKSQPLMTIEEYVDGYSWRGDEGDYTPTDHEKALLIDALHGAVYVVDGDFVFASRHGDEAGECIAVDVEPAKLRELREKLASTTEGQPNG